MSSGVRITNAGLRKDQELRLQNAGVKSIRDMMEKVPAEIVFEASMCQCEVDEVYEKLSSRVIPSVMTADKLLGERWFFPTSLGPLDEALSGGLPCGTLTEANSLSSLFRAYPNKGTRNSVVGPAGVGKTQFNLTLTAICSFGYGCVEPKDVLYIDTEGSFSAQRLMELLSMQGIPQVQVQEAIKRVHLFSPQSMKDLNELVDTMEELVISHDVKLIIVDSVAALARSEFNSGNSVERSQHLANFAGQLKDISATYDLIVVVSNQVKRRFSKEKSFKFIQNEEAVDGRDDEDDVAPALGPTWAHLPSVRLLLEYDKLSPHIRWARIGKCPYANNVKVQFEITAEGLNTGSLQRAGGRHTSLRGKTVSAMRLV